MCIRDSYSISLLFEAGRGPAERGARLRRARSQKNGEGAVRRAHGGVSFAVIVDVGEPGLRGVVRKLVCSYGRVDGVPWLSRRRAVRRAVGDVTVLGLVGGAPGGETPRVADSSAAGAGRFFHNSVPPSKLNRLGKPPRTVCNVRSFNQPGA